MVWRSVGRGLNGFLVAIAFLKANAIVFKPPNSELFGYRQIA